MDFYPFSDKGGVLSLSPKRGKGYKNLETSISVSKLVANIFHLPIFFLSLDDVF